MYVYVIAQRRPSRPVNSRLDCAATLRAEPRADSTPGPQGRLQVTLDVASILLHARAVIITPAPAAKTLLHAVPEAAPLRRCFSSKNATSTSSSVTRLAPCRGAQSDAVQGWLGRVSSYSLSLWTTAASCSLCSAIFLASASLRVRVSSCARAIPLARLA